MGGALDDLGRAVGGGAARAVSSVSSGAFRVGGGVAGAVASGSRGVVWSVISCDSRVLLGSVATVAARLGYSPPRRDARMRPKPLRLRNQNLPRHETFLGDFL